MHTTWVLLGSLCLLMACSAPQVIRSPRRPEVAGIPQTHTVVFVHGMFVTPLCWEKWQKYFQERGYTTLAPAWPEHDAPVEELRRRHPSKALAALTIPQILERYRTVIQGLPEKPILVGHSMGGLLVQLLLQEGLGAAGIAIDSAPPKGVFSLKWSFLKSNVPVAGPGAKLEEPYLMPLAHFQYAFVNGLPEAEQRAAYAEQVVPESRRVGKGATTEDGRIDFARPRPPLLLIAGEKDHIIPASLNRTNYQKYAKSPSITDFREFPGRTHWIIAQAGWEEVADHVLTWIKENQP